MIVRAVLAHSDGASTLEYIELDEPRADEILVRLVACGICHTDLVTRVFWPQTGGGRYPAVFGHEGAGVVETVGARRRARPARRLRRAELPQLPCLPRVRRAGQPVLLRGTSQALNASGTRADGTTTLHAAGAPVYGSFFGQSSFADPCSRLRRQHGRRRIRTLDLSVAAPLGCGVQTGSRHGDERARARRARRRSPCSAPVRGRAVGGDGGEARSRSRRSSPSIR